MRRQADQQHKMKRLVIILACVVLVSGNCRVRKNRKEAVCVGTGSKPAYLKFVSRITVRCGSENPIKVHRYFSQYSNKTNFMDCGKGTAKNVTDIPSDVIPTAEILIESGQPASTWGWWIALAVAVLIVLFIIIGSVIYCRRSSFHPLLPMAWSVDES